MGARFRGVGRRCVHLAGRSEQPKRLDFPGNSPTRAREHFRSEHQGPLLIFHTPPEVSDMFCLLVPTLPKLRAVPERDWGYSRRVLEGTKSYKRRMKDYSDFFREATGNCPYPYQARLASMHVASRTLRVPTGAGKTAAS